MQRTNSGKYNTSNQNTLFYLTTDLLRMLLYSILYNTNADIANNFAFKLQILRLSSQLSYNF